MNKLENYVLEQVFEHTVGPDAKSLTAFETDFVTGISQGYDDRELSYKQVDTLITIHDKVTH